MELPRAPSSVVEHVTFNHGVLGSIPRGPNSQLQLPTSTTSQPARILHHEARIRRGAYMSAKSLQELFVEELRDAYDGEKRLTKALPRMAKAAENEDLRAAFTSHLRETERHVQRLEQVFRSVGEPVRGKKCDGLMGIIEEGNSAIDRKSVV